MDDVRESSGGMLSGPPSLGQRLRERRKALRLTLKDVAEGAGLSTGFISQAERDIAAPSLSSLGKIAVVLGVEVKELLPELRPAPEASRHDEREIFQVASKAALTGFERISTTFPGSRLSGVIMHEPSGHRDEPQSHEGEEIFFMLDGSLTVELDGQRTVLNAGDSLHFSSRRRHSTWNHTSRPSVVLHVCTMDVFGDRISDDGGLPDPHAAHRAGSAKPVSEKDPS